MFENVDGRTDAGVTGILIAHLGAFGSGELKKQQNLKLSSAANCRWRFSNRNKLLDQENNVQTK